MKRVSSQGHPSQSLLGELRALANRSLCADVLVLDARALRVWASSSGDGLLVDALAAPTLRDALEALHLSRNELLEALRVEPPPPTIPPPAPSEPPPPPPPAPTGSLGPFEVVDVIEDGRITVVFRARIRTPGAPDRLVLVRRVRIAPSSREPIAALIASIRAVARIAHPNVVDVLEVGADDDAYWIVSEDLRGLSLTEILQSAAESGVPRHLLAASVVAQLADGLHVIHEQCGDDGAALDVVYRHVSPRAALAMPDGQIKILPFGSEGDATEPESGRDYRAPEQVREEPVDRRADIFALGVLLQEMAAGELSGLEAIALRALHERPEERYQSASAMSEALRAYLAQAGAESAEAAVRAWWDSRKTPREVTSAIDLERRPLRERALDHLSSNASLEAIRHGTPAHVTHTSRDLGYIARSFARLYLLVLLYESEFDPTRAEVALKRALPRVQSLMSAIAADILS